MLTALLLAGSVCGVRAQGASSGDSLAFHRGQWGARFSLESPFVGIGGLAFTSERSAWTLDASLAIQNRQGADSAGPTTHDANSQLSISFGRRHYGLLGRRVRSFYGVGLSGIAIRGKSDQAGLILTNHSWGAGVFGELGAVVFLSPHITVGAFWPLNVQYLWTRSRVESNPPASQKLRSLQITANSLSLIGELYF
jgi:hypothetical protein